MQRAVEKEKTAWRVIRSLYQKMVVLSDKHLICPLLFRYLCVTQEKKGRNDSETSWIYFLYMWNTRVFIYALFLMRVYNSYEVLNECLQRTENTFINITLFPVLCQLAPPR